MFYRKTVIKTCLFSRYSVVTLICAINIFCFSEFLELLTLSELLTSLVISDIFLEGDQPLATRSNAFTSFNLLPLFHLILADFHRLHCYYYSFLALMFNVMLIWVKSLLSPTEWAHLHWKIRSRHFSWLSRMSPVIKRVKSGPALPPSWKIL